MLHSDIVHIFVVFLRAGLLNLRTRLLARSQFRRGSTLCARPLELYHCEMPWLYFFKGLCVVGKLLEMQLMNSLPTSPVSTRIDR